MGKWVKRLASEWAAIFEAQSRSGRSAAKYCRDEGIPYKQYLYIRKKERQSKMSLAIAASEPVVPAIRNRGFVPVMIERGSLMRVKFPRGMVVESEGILPASWVVEAAERWLRMGG